MCLDLQKNFPEVKQTGKTTRDQPSSQHRPVSIAVCYGQVHAMLDQDMASDIRYNATAPLICAEISSVRAAWLIV